MASAAKTQLFKEVTTIANEKELCKNESGLEIFDVNDMLRGAIDRLRGAEPSRTRTEWVVVPDVSFFHERDDAIGIFTREKATGNVFDRCFSKFYGKRVTVIVFWRTWMWYGTYRDVGKTLGAFFETMRSKRSSETLECCVCMEDSSTLRLEYGFTCDHLFCTECLKNVICSTDTETCRTCPLCRAKCLGFVVGTNERKNK